MSLRIVICLVLIVAVSPSAIAAPFVPASDGEVLERLPFSPNDPVTRELRALRGELTRSPDNLPLAVQLAQGYLEQGRITGDLRYTGYAQAALTPWWRLEQTPPQVLALRATIGQRLHQFDSAVADLGTVLNTNPRNAQAHLTRATVLQVQGAFEGAREDCRTLQTLAEELVWAACLASVNGATGRLRDSYRQLLAALDRHPNARPRLQAWVFTSLAEMATRAGMAQEAERHFRAALTLDPADYYLLGAYADFLLDSDRSTEVVTLLQDETRADPLLLRYALALQVQHSTELVAQVQQLRDRFEAERLRGDRVHLREEARFTLHLLNDSAGALRLAQQNWQVQKEPADVRVLLEAALAAGNAAAVDAVTEWLSNSRMKDVQLTRLMPDTKRLSQKGSRE